MYNYPFKKQIKTATRKRYGSKKKGYKYGRMIKDGAKVASMTSIARDVMVLKRAINSEKKKANLFLDDAYFGLTYTTGATTGGYYASYMHPVIQQGNGSNERNGNSVKLVSAMFQAQFTPQTSADHTDLSFRWYIVNKPDANVATSPVTMANQLLNNNPFNGQLDTFSNRDPEFFTAYKIVATGSGKLKMSETDSSSKVPTWNVKQPLRLSLHQKYNGNANTNTTKNQLYLLCVADGGDSGPGFLTGINLKWTVDYYYVDN